MNLLKILLQLAVMSFFLCGNTQAQDLTSILQLARVKKDVRSKRVSSYDRTGNNQDFIRIKADSTREIFSAERAGVITHIWVTINHDDHLSRRNLILRMYWDNETEPSVQAPIGDFFGQGWGEFYNYSTPWLSSGPAEGRAMVCYFPMPFAKGARITIQNDSRYDVPNFYYYVDYQEIEKPDPDLGRFHAWWNHQVTEALPEGENEWDTLGKSKKNTTGDRNYLFMETTGAGQYMGVNYYINCPTPMWYGEGDDMFFIDGEKWPCSLHGTGTEDYFNMSWCPKEFYQHPFYGLVRPNRETGWLGRTHCYRFHILDPIRFSKSIRATIEHGHNDNLTLDLASVAYWYQTEPHQAFPAIEKREARVPKPQIGVEEIHIWRDAWRKAMGNSPTLWGNEKPGEAK